MSVERQIADMFLLLFLLLGIIIFFAGPVLPWKQPCNIGEQLPLFPHMRERERGRE